MTTQSEIERKYDVDEHAVLPGFEGVPGVSGTRVAGEYELSAEYFDTAGQHLAEHRITLRRREGGTDEGWHLKLPAAEGRTELRWPLDTGAGTPVPDEVRRPVQDIVRDRPLALLALIRTRRSITYLLNDGGVEIVELADDTVTARDPATGTVRTWREWEAELTPDAPASVTARTRLLDDVGERLATAGARPAASVSKLASALGRTALGSSPSPGSPLGT